jgi:hypothetical protein
MENLKKTVETLFDKAAKTTDPVHAMNWAQAACNAANALRVLVEIGRTTKA